MAQYKPNLTTLTCFEAAARHESFTDAAQELGMTQSAVSKAVRELEAGLGLKLFRRVGRGVRLTTIGQSYAADTSLDLQHLETSRLKAISAGQSKRLLRIATLPSFANSWLIPKLPKFLIQHPDIELDFATRLEPFDFDESPFDLAFHYGIQNWPGCQMVALFSEEMIPVCAPALFQDYELSNPNAIVGAPLLHLTSRPEAWSDWLDFAGIQGSPQPTGMRFDQFSMLINAATSGIGIALVPMHMVAHELGTGLLTRLPGGALATDKAYHIVHPPGETSIPAKQFIRWLQINAAQMRNQME